MTNYYDPVLWQGRMPNDVTVVTEVTDGNFYSIGASRTISFPWGIDQNQQALITAMHETFWQRQQFSIRAWASLEPGGDSITKIPFASQSSISLSGAPATWLFYPSTMLPQGSAGIIHTVPAAQCLWFNLKNACNEDNRCFFTIVI